MTRILGISGSLRTASLNTALLRTIEAMALPGIELDLVTLHGIPLYDSDLEARDGLPAAVVALKDKVANADAVLLATPEYNNGIPGVFKNAIDWLSRPANEIPRVFGDRPFAVIGASPGGFGTILAQDAWWPVLHTLGTRTFHGSRFMLSRAHTLIGADGLLQDDKARGQLAEFVTRFAAFAAD